MRIKTHRITQWTKARGKKRWIYWQCVLQLMTELLSPWSDSIWVFAKKTNLIDIYLLSANHGRVKGQSRWSRRDSTTFSVIPDKHGDNQSGLVATSTFSHKAPCCFCSCSFLTSPHEVQKLLLQSCWYGRDFDTRWKESAANNPSLQQHEPKWAFSMKVFTSFRLNNMCSQILHMPEEPSK